MITIAVIAINHADFELFVDNYSQANVSFRPAYHLNQINGMQPDGIMRTLNAHTNPEWSEINDYLIKRLK